MLNQLRRKFVLVNMLLVGVLLTVIVCLICFYTYYNLKSDLDNSMKNSLRPPTQDHYKPVIGEHGLSPDMAYSIVLTVIYDKQTGTVSNLSDNVNISEEALQSAVDAAVLSESDAGTLYDLNLYYKKRENPNNIMISFTDRSYVTATLTRYVILLFSVEAAAMIIVFLISRFLARLAIKPIEEVWEGQKRFIADASHELKTPLTVIMANNSILHAQKDSTVAAQMQWIESTDAEAKHMEALITDMLTLARSEAGTQANFNTPVDLSNIANRTLLQFEALAFDKKIAISGDIADGITVRGSEAQLTRLVMILLDNAVKHEMAGGEIKATLSKAQGKAELSVHNTTSVIAPDALPHIFERFYRTDASSEGFGLGLAIAKSVSEAHKGKIAVRSGKGYGTEFKVELPLI